MWEVPEGNATPQYTFKEFGKQQQIRAEQTSGAHLISSLARLSGASPRRWEAALFMIGYSVRG